MKYQKNILLPAIDKSKRLIKIALLVPKFKAHSMVDVVWCTVSAVFNVSALGYFRAIPG